MLIKQVFSQIQEAYLLINSQSWSLEVINTGACHLLQTSTEKFTSTDLWLKQLLPTLQLQTKLQAAPTNLVVYHNNIQYHAHCSFLNEDQNTYLAIRLSHLIPNDQEIHNFFSLVDNLGAYVYCKDLNYCYTYANQQVCDLFGCSISEVIGKNDHQLFCQETGYTLVEESDRPVMEQGKVITKEEHIFVPFFNEMRTYLVVKKPLFDAQGKISGLFGISTDITEQKKIEQKLRDNEQTLNTVLDNVGAYIFIKDTDCRFRYINKLTEQLFQKKSEEIVGMNNFELLGPEQGAEFERTDREVFDNGKQLNCLETFDGEGETLYYWTVKIPLRDNDGNIDSYIGISTDITEQKRLEHQARKSNKKLKKTIKEINLLKDELQHQATHDALTGLYNRRFLEEHGQVIFTDSSRTPSSLLMIDADHFKQVNDLFGHDAGDEMLKHLASVMSEECRGTDIICRHGGEEFIILLPDTPLGPATQRAEWIRKEYEISAARLFPDVKNCTISVGVASSPQHGKDFMSVFQAADKALYKAKNLGRNRSSVAE